MKLYYPFVDNKCTAHIVQEDFDKLEDWLKSHTDYILQEEVLYNGSRANNDQVKRIDGVVVLKDDEDYKQDRIANAEQSKAELLNACTQYQTGDADPRIDSNFFSLLMASQTVKKINPAFICVCCDKNIEWNNILWADYSQRKIDIDNGDVPNYDFTNNGNPPHSWDECQSELT